MANIVTFQDILLNCVHLAMNKEQNAHVPPYIISSAVRLSTDFLLDEIVRIYPHNQRIVDKARPFIKRKLISIDEGIGELPEDYRNILAINIAVNKDDTGGCNCEDEVPKCEEIDDHCTEVNKASVRREKCKFNSITIVSQDQYAEATRSVLIPPTYEHPIGMFIGENKIKVCPIDDITYAEVLYIRQPKRYNIGFALMADDTWQIVPTNPNHIEVEWDSNASGELFKAVSSLLGIHTRDGNFIKWNNELKKIGIF